MQLVASLLLFLFVLVVYAAFLKLSGRILRFQGVAWSGVLLFSLMIGALTLGTRFVTALAGVDLSLPLPVALAYGIGFHLGLAAWFFRNRLTDGDGSAAGWIGGVKLSGLAILFLGFMAAALFAFAMAVIPESAHL